MRLSQGLLTPGQSWGPDAPRRIRADGEGLKKAGGCRAKGMAGFGGGCTEKSDIE